MVGWCWMIDCGGGSSGGGGGGGDRGSSNGKGREEGTGQIFPMFAAEGVDFESVAGADGTVRTQEHGAVIPFILFSSPFFLFLSFFLMGQP